MWRRLAFWLTMLVKPSSRAAWSLALVGCLAQVALANPPPGSEDRSVRSESHVDLPEGPLSPSAALTEFRCAADVRVELVAAEPLIESPVAFAFDEVGALYVAENRGYPIGPADGEPPLGRIARLTDADQDGTYDTRTEFAAGLTFPNGVMPWRGGLIVTCAPDILYLKDTDGDGRADERTVWLTGFSTKGSTQLRVSHPTLGLDNWIYVTSGLTGGKVTCPAHPERAPLEFGRSDFRFRPDLGEYETCDGGGQFGLSFDDFGRRFICYNRVQVQHVVLPSRSLERNPRLAFSETIQNCPIDLAPEPLPGHGQGARLFPISANVTTADSHAGTFTAACSVFAWRGASLPASYGGGVFSCDPTGNLIHFDKLTPQGATFVATPEPAGAEFLASRDNWFRPVFLGLGPDDALYVCDMYRKTIEHPDYLPVEIRKRTDFASGRNMGRIWRVVDKNVSAATLTKRRRASMLSGDDPQAATRLLIGGGAFARDLAQRWFAEEPARGTVSLRALAPTSHLPAATEVAVLNQLATRDALDEAMLLRALRSSDARVREQAVRLAASRLRESPVIVAAALPLAVDAAPRVRFEWALAMGNLADDRALPGLAQVAARDANDRWARAAVLSSIGGREIAFWNAFNNVAGPTNAGLADFDRDLGRLLGASCSDADIAALLRRVVSADLGVLRRAAQLTGVADALRNRPALRAAGLRLSTAFAGDTSGGDVRARTALEALFAYALRIAADDQAVALEREIALRLLAHADYATAGKTLLTLVDTSRSRGVCSAAIAALAAMPEPEVATELLAATRYAAYLPAVREDVLAAMLSSQDHVPGLLAALEAGDVPARDINPLRRQQLLDRGDPALRDRAKAIFAAPSSGERAAAYERAKAALVLKPTAANGQALFRKHCANCHRLDREGFAVGPDLFGIRNQTKEAILLHVVLPEREITQGFAAYVLETVDGRVLTGLVASETPVSVTLRQPLGKEETVLRADVAQLSASPLSLMPQDFEKLLSPQDMADLLAYLKGEGQR